MYIKSLEQMEAIVKNNRSLSWDGWSVVEMIKSPTAMFKTSGAFKNGAWFIKKTYSCDEKGWNIPGKYVR